MKITTRSLILNGNIGVSRKIIAIVDVSALPEESKATITISIEKIDNGVVIGTETLSKEFTREGYNIWIWNTEFVCRYVRVSVDIVNINCVYDIQFLGIGDILA